MSKWLNVRDGVQYDMHLHGSRFIIVEFALTAGLALVLFALSVNFALHTQELPWWYVPWIIVCAGIFLNSVAVTLLARDISKLGGARPPLPKNTDGVWLLPLLVVIPLLLPILAWLQRNER